MRMNIVYAHESLVSARIFRFLAESEIVRGVIEKIK